MLTRWQIEGIDVDLGISGIQWNIVLSLFFVPYILLEVPSNILLKRFERPSLYMGMLVTTWGVIMTMHGVVTNYAGLLSLRSKCGSKILDNTSGIPLTHILSTQFCLECSKPASSLAQYICARSGTCQKISLPESRGSTASAHFQVLSRAWQPLESLRWTELAAMRAGDGSF